MDSSQPQFSILIPTSGRADLFRMAIESVLKQNFQDFEIIIADGSGLDAVRAAATESGDPRVRYVHAPDGGLTTWDVAAKSARGKYLLWLDDDNYLLPYALDLFKKAIDRTGADVVTANHLYYYDNRHPRRFLRNCLGVIPFTDRGHSLNLGEIFESQFSFLPRGAGLALPRLHVSATAVSRRMVEQAISRLGFVLPPGLGNVHSLQTIIFAFAQSCYFIDHPVVIIGRLGISSSQIWSTAARRKFARTPFAPKLSPVSGYTRINTVLENYLCARQLLPDLLGGFSINFERFALLYLHELSFLDTDLGTAAKNWKELYKFLKTLPAEAQQELIPEFRKRVTIVPMIFIARRLKLHFIWRLVYGWSIRVRGEGARPYSKREGEFAIPIERRYQVDSIAKLAAHVREIILTHLARDIYALNTDLF